MLQANVVILTETHPQDAIDIGSRQLFCCSFTYLMPADRGVAMRIVAVLKAARKRGLLGPVHMDLNSKLSCTCSKTA